MKDKTHAFGRVLVVYGGQSAEREVSLQSGEAIVKALKNQGVDVLGFDLKEHTLTGLLSLTCDRVFIALHGRGGEDGTLQGALDLIQVPYTGSGVLASALAMNKWLTKQIWMAQGIPTPSAEKITIDVTTHRHTQAQSSYLQPGHVRTKLNFPIMVKPLHEGSSIGMAKVANVDQLQQALKEACLYDTEILLEECVQGEEFTVAWLGDQVLPPVRVGTQHGFFDYDAKYKAQDTQYHIPSGLSEEKEAELKALVIQAYQSLGAHGWGRADVMQDAMGQFWFLEINTVPGMTDHSLVPKAASAAGIDFEELVMRILGTTMHRGGKYDQ